MKTFCGDTVPPFSYVSVANKMTVEFTSDVETQMAGFIAYWDRVPPNGTVSGYIQSPSYPDSYKNCENERWVLQAPKVGIIQIGINKVSSYIPTFRDPKLEWIF